MHRLSPSLLASAAFMLASCAVGPDFERPAAPDVKRYTETEMPPATASAQGQQGAAQTFVSDADIPAQWWTVFGSPELNTLMTQALAANPDLLAAKAALKVAKENYYAERGELLPQVDADFSPVREKFNPSAFGETGAPSSIFTLYNASVSVSYGIDIFGGTRRLVEEARAQRDYARFEMEAAYLTLTTNVVTAAVQEASLREQVKETQSIVDIEAKQLDVLKKQFELGASPKATVLEQEAALSQVETTLPPLQKQLAQTRNTLAVLVGKVPANAPAETFTLAGLQLPQNLPLTLPSKLVEQRPDIKAAESLLHAASAQIGVATANMLPKVTLSGSYGWESTHFTDLATPGAEVWSIGAGILQPLFHGGTLLHQRRAAVAAFEQSKAQYESTVLGAFKNVADTLRALQYDADGLKAQANAAEVAKSSLELTQTQFQVGAISYPQLLDAQRTYAQTRIGLVQAQAARLADTAALFQALGGDWQAKPAPAAAEASTTITTTTPAVPAAPADSQKQQPVTSEKKP